MLVAVLAVAKAGAAYLPLDLNSPSSRLASIIEDARPTSLLTTRNVSVPTGSARRVCLDDRATWEAIERQSATNPTDSQRTTALLPSHAAYIVYTSGSTGQPKGVVVSHVGIPSLVGAQVERFNITSTSRVLQFANLTFDASFAEIAVTLAAGATLVLIEEQARSGLALSSRLRLDQITHVTLPPVVLPTLEDPDNIPLETLIVAGESCSGALIDRWSRGRRVINAYGPTETTVCATMSKALSGSAPPPIGRPIWNTRVYVLDEALEPVPVGVTGEVYLAGRGLARGYLRRAGQTAERFVADPYGASGTRMYRTGDRGRWRPDGQLDFLGRVDGQVKLRGHRVEVEEVAAVLRHEGGVQDAVVVMHGEGEAAQLVGYVVGDPAAAAATAARQDAYVDDWARLYDATYAETPGSDFNLAGWVSSETGMAIPAVEMRAWVDATVARLTALGARDVLEVGCGTGLLLTRVAPSCRSYVGVDVSAAVVAQVAALVHARPALQHVTVRVGRADALPEVGDASVDLVVLNSVVQYFPDVSYLLAAVQEAVRVTRPGGHIFIGDVRSRPLLEAFHGWVQLAHAAPGTAAATVWQRTQQAVAQERELVVDPALFTELGRRWPGVGRVWRTLKAGAYVNELSRFRYDVVLERGENQELAAPLQWVSWDAAGRWRGAVEAQLAATPGAAVGVRGVRDRRVAGPVAAVRALATAGPNLDVAAVRAAAAAESGEDPDAVWKWATARGLSVAWEGSGDDGVDDMVVAPQWRPVRAGPWSAAAYQAYGTRPAARAAASAWGRTLQAGLRQRLPAYMVPSAVVVLEAWPLTPNGKIDRGALLPPPRTDAPVGRAPRTATETQLCALFAEVLGVAHVGLDDDFFALGGHSLLAMRLISRVRVQLDIELQVRDIFAASTPGALSAIVSLISESQQPAGGDVSLAPDLEENYL
jgi:pristinamycin I synthase 3 and 4